MPLESLRCVVGKVTHVSGPIEVPAAAAEGGGDGKGADSPGRGIARSGSGGNWFEMHSTAAAAAGRGEGVDLAAVGCVERLEDRVALLGLRLRGRRQWCLGVRWELASAQPCILRVLAFCCLAARLAARWPLLATRAARCDTTMSWYL